MNNLDNYVSKFLETFKYEDRFHKSIPHVINFSGGRTSGLLMFLLLESGFLNKERGDVIVFNNTSAEHPETYKFVARCKKEIEEVYDFPVFLTEFVTYEDLNKHGDSIRKSSYRLIQPEPKEINPNGYRWRGEVYEELMSHKKTIPTKFKRICTAEMKIRITRSFMKDYFHAPRTLAKLGRERDEYSLNFAPAYEHYLRYHGKLPFDIWKRKQIFVRSQPCIRPFQNYASYSKSFIKPNLIDLSKNPEKEFLVFLGIRTDEPNREQNIKLQLKSREEEGIGYAYMPLCQLDITKQVVADWWREQDFNLSLPEDGVLSNCTYCFLKGVGNLVTVKDKLENYLKNNPDLINTPVDIDWWIDKEANYGEIIRTKDDPAEDDYIHFFGIDSRLNFKKLKELESSKKAVEVYSENALPCDCTD